MGNGNCFLFTAIKIKGLFSVNWMPQYCVWYSPAIIFCQLGQNQETTLVGESEKHILGLFQIACGRQKLSSKIYFGSFCSFYTYAWFPLGFYSVMDCKQFLKEPLVRIHCWKRFHTFTLRSICFSSWLKNRSLSFISSLSSFCIKGKRSASTCQLTIISEKQTTHSRKARLDCSLLCLSVCCWHMCWCEGENSFFCTLRNGLFS